MCRPTRRHRFRRFRYDRHALLGWSLLAWTLMLVSYGLMPAPPVPLTTPNLPVNIDYVYGFSDRAPQHWMPPLAFLAVMLLAMPVCIFLPTHLLLTKVCKSAVG